MAMPKPLDATLRNLFELEPVAWLEVFDAPVPDPGLVGVIDSNLSTVTAETDKLVRVGGPEPYLFHPEFLSGRAPGYPEHLHWYNSLASHRHGLPVLSVVVLLRPTADGPELTGEYERAVPGWGWNLWFRYKVIRVWELPPERLLAAGLPVLPLAPVSQVPAERLPEILRAVADRLRNEAGPGLKATLWAATEILLGLYHPSERVQELTGEITTMILGIRGIEESSVYQDIFAKGEAKGRAEGEAKGRAEGEARGRAEGELEEARKILLGLGGKKLGPPDERILALVAGISDRDRINLLLDRILDVASWGELLATAES
jgi:hypothetical protein